MGTAVRQADRWTDTQASACEAAVVEHAGKGGWCMGERQQQAGMGAPVSGPSSHQPSFGFSSTVGE